jgi:hypothetical protein
MSSLEKVILSMAAIVMVVPAVYLLGVLTGVLSRTFWEGYRVGWAIAKSELLEDEEFK